MFTKCIFKNVVKNIFFKNVFLMNVLDNYCRTFHFKLGPYGRVLLQASNTEQNCFIRIPNITLKLFIY